MFDLSLFQVNDSECFIDKDINFHEIWIKVNILNFQNFFFISFFDYAIPIFKLNVIYSRSKDS